MSQQVRGSSLLLFGELLAKVIHFSIHILIIRHLSKSDFGAFAYALSIVTLGEALATFGLNRAVSRLVPIYHEQGDYNKLFGTLFLVLSTILALGLSIVLVVYGCRGFIASSVISDQQALGLLLLLIGLSPIQALDAMFVGLFAAFANPRAIFFRRYLLAPGLQLIVVLLLIAGDGDAPFLAVGYLAAGLLGVAICTVILFRVLHDQGLFNHFNLRAIKIPLREAFTFAFPLFTVELVYLLMDSLDAVLLEHFGGTADVAIFRAVQPVAKLNQMVFLNFGLLFTPLIARLFARSDHEGINNLYWQSTVWIAVITFPIFALTFSQARPLTILICGPRYEQSAVILALLSCGYYFHSILGFNGTTLMVFGKVRYIVLLNMLTVVVNLGINLLLIPRYGALGAAIGACGTLVVHNFLKHAGLRFCHGVSLFQSQYLKICIVITIAALGLMLIQLLFFPPIYVGLMLAAMASLLVFYSSRKSLIIGQTFPELSSFPLIRLFLSD